MSSNVIFGKEGKVEELVKHLRNELEHLQNIPVLELLKFLDAFGKQLLEKKGKEMPEVKQLAQFLSFDHTKKMLDFSLRGSYTVLDTFIDLGHTRLLTCQPRGLIVHWLSGNVAILGMYSIFQALMTKNVSLVKASSRAYEDLISILTLIKEVNTDTVKGEEIAQSIQVILVDREDRTVQEYISKEADVRIAWGSNEAIETILNLPKKVTAEDIVFGPKYSFGIVEKEGLEQAKEVALRIAFDISTFDQYACSSPHTLFVQEGGVTSPEAFAALLAEQMKLVNEKMLPKGEEDPGKKMEILTVRAKQAMKGKVWSSQNTDWTVVYDNSTGFADACFSRVITVKPFKDGDELPQLSKKVQTIGYAGKKESTFLKRYTVKGGDRIVPVGEATLFESPWDGMFPVERMVRWCSVWK